MKKLLGLLLITGIYANAGWITSAQSFNDEEIKTEKRSLDTYGQNPRAYVFTIGQKDGAKTPMQCVIVYTEQDLGENKAKSTAPVMQCIELKN